MVPINFLNRYEQYILFFYFITLRMFWINTILYKCYIWYECHVSCFEYTYLILTRIYYKICDKPGKQLKLIVYLFFVSAILWYWGLYKISWKIVEGRNIRSNYITDDERKSITAKYILIVNFCYLFIFFNLYLYLSR